MTILGINFKKDMFFQFIIIFFLIIVFIFFYIKYFEKKGIFYPSSKIEITPQSLGLDFEDVYFLTDDGVKINGWFVKKDDAPFIILFCHGNAGNISHRVEIINMFNKVGFGVFIFDYRGYGNSKGRPSEFGMYLDASAAYNYLVKERRIPQDKVIIYGKSIGANVGIQLASRACPGLLIVDSGFTHAFDMAKVIFPLLPKFIFRYIISVRFDALSKIKKISTPKLIIHSKDDEIVPFKLGEALFSQAMSPKEFYITRGSHNETIFLYEDDFILRITEFVKKYKNYCGKNNH